MNRYKQYTEVCYSGTKLLKEHSLEEYGIWQVRGEDSNCDLGGHHYMPELGIFEGYLKDVLQVAVELPGFWTWGGGGDITKKNLEKIDSTTAQVRKQKRELLKNLESQVADLKKELSL